MRKKTALQTPENRKASPKQNQRRRRVSLTTALIERFVFLLRDQDADRAPQARATTPSRDRSKRLIERGPVR